MRVSLPLATLTAVVALLAGAGTAAAQPLPQQSSPERAPTPTERSRETVEPVQPPIPEEQPADEGALYQEPQPGPAQARRAEPSGEMFQDQSDLPDAVLPEPAPATVPPPEEQAREELREREAASDVDQLTSPDNTVTMRDPVSPEDAARAEGMTGLTVQPEPAPQPDRTAADPVPLPDVPEAAVKALKDEGVTGIDVPPGVGEPPQPGQPPQGQPPQGEPAQAGQPATANASWTAVIGRTVRDLDGQEVGRIEDLLVSDTGALTHALVQTGDRMLALPWSDLQTGRQGPEVYVSARKDTLLSDRAFAYEDEAEAAVRPPPGER